MNTQGKVEIEAAEHASTPTQQSYKRTCGPAERRSPSNLLRPACSRQSAWESRASLGSVLHARSGTFHLVHGSRIQILAFLSTFWEILHIWPSKNQHNSFALRIVHFRGVDFRVFRLHSLHSLQRLFFLALHSLHSLQCVFAASRLRQAA